MILIRVRSAGYAGQSINDESLFVAPADAKPRCCGELYFVKPTMSVIVK